MKYEIGKRIRAFRENTGMSQKEFASKIGVSNARVSNWEQGINRPDADTLPAICEALGISPNDLLNTPSGKQLPADALEIAKAFANLTPAGKELVQSVIAFASKHHAKRTQINDADIPLPRIGTVHGVPLFQMPDDMRLPTKMAAKEELKELNADVESAIKE